MRLYMRFSHVLLVCAFCAMLTSCFKEEPLNAECDIEYAYLHSDDPSVTFFQPSDSLVRVISNTSRIEFGLKKADLTALAPQFVLTEGATISPESGSVQDFSQGPVTYIVTSQDGSWTRSYQVHIYQKSNTTDALFSFETTRMDETNRYTEWYEITGDGREDNIWATGNAGFAITAGDALPEEYPSSILEEGYNGKGVRLVTRNTGTLGVLFHMPIAAGNLFTGSFDALGALGNARKGTLFGTPVNKKPVSFSGYYKYTPGEVMTGEDNQPIPGKEDKGDIYAILYRNTDSEGSPFTLDGDNVKTSDQIVATALLDEVKTATEWTPFDINFTYKEQLDEQILRNYGYSLAIVFSSSINGAYFEGAVGSTLCIDEVKVSYEITE